MSNPEIINEIRLMVDPYLNGLIVQAFGSGVYTLLFCQAIWIIYKKGSRGLYPVALILLWMSLIYDFGLQWSVSNAGFVVDNSSPVTLLIRLNAAMSPAILIPSILAVPLSDAILIWRCNIMWRNKDILIVLIMLLTATTGTLISGAFPASLRQFKLMILSLGLFSSSITTVSTTTLIALKIIIVTRRSRMRYSYEKIREILVESAAIVLIGTLGLTIVDMVLYVHPVHLDTISGRFAYGAGEYINYLQSPTTGIGPTLIAFRVAMQSPQTEVGPSHKTTAVSRLTFRRSGHDSATSNQELHARVSVGSIQSVMGGEAQEGVAAEKEQRTSVTKPEAIQHVESV
ncbi:hypothetical protein D9619_013638 [Psilocybe cf. subviscida]|uniref:Uncharacterized protein n=1 Tax=Psilocybe cf. subviscida TaxID=2480587 RepID=A0A8H5BRN6_9AGAR|nr:hypothetical protein D9619_013638 [Psilocybe cf. subviscida]